MSATNVSPAPPTTATVDLAADLAADLEVVGIETAFAGPQADERTRPLWRVGARAGVLAAVATTAVAMAAQAADVPIEVGGESIPLPGFAQVTLVCVAIGVLIAMGLSRWAARPQRTFVAVTGALTAASLLPDLAADATTATRLVLMTTHLVAAAIVIPMVARRLPARRG
jgi:hypothetical protein